MHNYKSVHKRHVTRAQNMQYIWTGYAPQYLIVPLKQNVLFHVYVISLFKFPKRLVDENAVFLPILTMSACYL